MPDDNLLEKAECRHGIYEIVGVDPADDAVTIITKYIRTPEGGCIEQQFTKDGGCLSERHYERWPFADV